MDYGKFLYEKSKSTKEQKKKQKLSSEGNQIPSGTDDGDYQVKLRNLIRFLEDGDKAKITLRFRGREMAHQQIGMEVLNRVRKICVKIWIWQWSNPSLRRSKAAR